jgi:hypothetical protein
MLIINSCNTTLHNFIILLMLIATATSCTSATSNYAPNLPHDMRLGHNLHRHGISINWALWVRQCSSFSRGIIWTTEQWHTSNPSKFNPILASFVWRNLAHLTGTTQFWKVLESLGAKNWSVNRQLLDRFGHFSAFHSWPNFSPY